MNLELNLYSEQIESINGIMDQVSVIVLLDSMWDIIMQKFTHIYLELEVIIPVIEDEESYNQIIPVFRTYKISDISNHQVTITIDYLGKLNENKGISGHAVIRGYRMMSS